GHCQFDSVVNLETTAGAARSAHPSGGFEAMKSVADGRRDANLTLARGIKKRAFLRSTKREGSLIYS
ncbi:MAG: hypothetical protein WBM28_11315, partial [Burkholderiales bacterium]